MRQAQKQGEPLNSFKNKYGMSKKNNPWMWVPSLYIFEGLPYFIVNTISVIVLKRLGLGNADVALYTGLLYLPWVIKPLWSPFVDVLRTKRWWIVSMQFVMTVGVTVCALAINPDIAEKGGSFYLLLSAFWFTAFASATHDIAADGYYMLSLDEHTAAQFVGIRNTFYRIASVFGQGVLVVMAGILEKKYGDIPKAWMVTLLSVSALFALMAVYHLRMLPSPETDRSRVDAKSSARSVLKELSGSFVTFFRKKGVVIAILFMLLYRLPEAFIVKMMNPFFLDPVSEGGLGLTTDQIGWAYGTFGAIALIAGGILGGFVAGRWGLKKCLWPMALSLTLPCLVFVWMATAQPSNIWLISAGVCLDQFGYGFGFTAYTLYLMYFSRGEYRTSHYSICTAFMALSMMIPGTVAGYLQEMLGYKYFFWMVICCFIATFAVVLSIKVDPEYAKKIS